MKTPMNAISTVIEVLFRTESHRAVKYLSENHVVRATWRRYRYNNRKPRKDGPVDVVLHVGRPNYKERQFIKQAKKAGEPFPIKRVQLQQPPAVRARK